MPTTVLMEELDAFTYRDLVGSGAPVIVPVGAMSSTVRTCRSAPTSSSPRR